VNITGCTLLIAWWISCRASGMQLVTFGEMYEVSTQKPAIKGKGCVITECVARILYVSVYVMGNLFHVGVKLTYRDLVFQPVSDRKFTNSVLV
jgi:hypothetical protein